MSALIDKYLYMMAALFLTFMGAAAAVVIWIMALDAIHYHVTRIKNRKNGEDK